MEYVLGTWVIGISYGVDLGSYGYILSAGTLYQGLIFIRMELYHRLGGIIS